MNKERVVRFVVFPFSFDELVRDLWGDILIETFLSTRYTHTVAHLLLWALIYALQIVNSIRIAFHSNRICANEKCQPIYYGWFSFEENLLSKIRVNKNKYLHVVIWIHVIPQMVIYLFDSFQM